MATLARAFATVPSDRLLAPTSTSSRGARVPVRCAGHATGAGVDSKRFGIANGDKVRGETRQTRASDTPTPNAGSDAPNKKKRRNKNRRRGPKKSDMEDVDTSVAPRRPPSAAAVALATAASADGGTAVAQFMGTFDEADGGSDIFGNIGAGMSSSISDSNTSPETEEDRRMRALAQQPDPDAVFMGTMDDDDLTFDFFSDKGKGSTKTKKQMEVIDLAPAPAQGHSDLQFLYDAETIVSITHGSGDIFGSDGSGEETVGSHIKPDVNAPEVVGRCNDVIRKCKSMDDVLAIVQEMTTAGVVPVESTYVAIMLVCRDTAVGPGRALEVYDAMKLVGVMPTTRSFDLAMTCCIRARRPEDALRLKSDAETHNINLHPRTFTALIKLISECDFGKKRGPKARLIKTCKLFEEMLSSGENSQNAQPPPAAFNVLIVAAAKARQPDLVARTFEELAVGGISPSRETYETTLAAVSAGGLVDFALDVFLKMRADGFAPRKTTYNSLLEACATCPQPRVEQAFEIFHRMSEEGRVAPNARTFALLIDAATRAGLPRFAFDAFDAMRAAGVDIPLMTYNRLIRAAGGDGDGTSVQALDQSGGVQTARALLNEIRDKTDLEPDLYTYGSVLGTCAAAAAAGDSTAANVACQTAEEMRNAGVQHNRATRHALIAALGRAGRWRQVLEEYVQMRGVDTDQTLAAEQLAELGTPGRETFGVVFDALLSSGGAEAAIAAVALEPGGGGTFIRGPRAACARAVFRDGIAAGFFDDPRVRLSESVDEDDTSPLRVNHVHMTRSEAVVATLFLLETFADTVGETNADTNADTSNRNLPSGLYIGEGPGTKGNAQRRTLAVENVLRAASVPCAPVEDPHAYVVGVTKEGLHTWIAQSERFQVVDLNDAELRVKLDNYAEDTKVTSS